MQTYFPTVPVEVALRRARPDSEPPLPLVMVADDESLIVETLMAILNANGLAAVPAMDGHSALEMARLAPPDILITDVKMPGLDGFALAREFSRCAPSCDTILLSGEPSSSDRAAEYRAQGLDFVLMIKPVHPLDLLACVFELLSLRGWLFPHHIPQRRNNPSDMVFLGPLSSRKKREVPV